MSETAREGSLEAPERHPIPWKEPAWWDRAALDQELARVFDICHGCRRCFNLCNAFPTLFDLIDESPTGELDGVPVSDFPKVVEQCYLCDICFMTKCPYVPPHPFNVDFPHLMLRAKAVYHREHGAPLRDRLLTSTDLQGRLLCHPGIADLVNGVNHIPLARALAERVGGIHREAWLPPVSARGPEARIAEREIELLAPEQAEPTDVGGVRTSGKVVLFETCYGRNNEPDLVADLAAVLTHNGIPVRLAGSRHCCGMPRLELGDLDAVERLREEGLPRLLEWVEEGWDILAPVPSCVLMLRQELPLLFPDDERVRRVAEAIADPFEYLVRRHRAGKLDLSFRRTLGKVAYHMACHQRVQNIGQRTREVLELVPDTKVTPIARCSGHDGTYAVKVEFHPAAARIARPVVRQVESSGANYFTSDCPMAAHHVSHVGGHPVPLVHPARLLCVAYGIVDPADAGEPG